jgi:hypothetical protein
LLLAWHGFGPEAKMTGRIGIRRGLALALALMLVMPQAMAQSRRGDRGADKDPADVVKGDPIPKGLIAPGNGGVAGTGLGGTTGGPIGGASGTGNSVSGPPGQGVDDGGMRKKPKSR